MVWRLGCAGAMAALLAAGCEREVRPFADLSAASARTQATVLSPLLPGGGTAASLPSSPYQKNAWGISEGKRLFEGYNCSGCHSHGGGGMGPALMDDRWIYGSRPEQIFSSIVEGRPNGMPAWRNKIPDDNVWKIVAYVESMSGNAPMDALPSRSDHMRYATPENARPAETLKQTGTP